MCARLHCGEDTIETMGELRAKFPIIVFHEEVDVSGYPEDYLCVCGVDLVETGRVNGVNVQPETDELGSTGDFVIQEKPTNLS